MQNYTIAREKHQDGSLHIHAYLKLNETMETNYETFADLVDPETPPDDEAPIYHGNYQACRSDMAVRRYCEEDGDFITSLKPLGARKRSTGPIWNEILRLARSGNHQAAMDYAETNVPRDFVLNHQKILSLVQKVTPPAGLTCHMTLEDFGPLPRLEERKTLIICGKSGRGKTSLAKLLYPTAQFITHGDTMQTFCPKRYTGIIFDDMSFKHWPRENQIHVVDQDNDAQLHCRYFNANIPAGTPKTITTNLKWDQILLDDPAIIRRIQVWKVKGRLTALDTIEKLHVKEKPLTTLIWPDNDLPILWVE